MQEKNKHILEEAIDKLPAYEPEDTLWIAIDAELELMEKEHSLQDAIAGLPAYHPPESVWTNIDQALESGRKGKLRKLWGRGMAIAAAAAIFILAGRFLFAEPSGEEVVTITYSEEETHKVLFEHDWNEDEDAFEEVLAFCREKHIVCELPEFKMLQSELEELNLAREELKTALEFYGTDPDLIARLTSIEHERSDVLKKMIAKI